MWDESCVRTKDSGKGLRVQEGYWAMNSMPDFGTVHENAAAFDVAVVAITSGESAWVALSLPPCGTHTAALASIRVVLHR